MATRKPDPNKNIEYWLEIAELPMFEEGAPHNAIAWEWMHKLQEEEPNLTQRALIIIQGLLETAIKHGRSTRDE